ncbi:hypothetical protein RYH80_16515 [Halobaculum sp. MBLA0147]|uniref:hypothetical protein n=1 Tax=Halobaculum sp. MBLA0147 TaxID=3079934 RepID=UPI00352500BC
MTVRRLARIVRGRVRERTRRRRFLAAVGVVAYLGASITTGTVGLTFGGTVAPVRNGPWLVSVAAMTATTVVLLGGWVVAGGVLERDRETGVGEVCAATAASDRLVFLATVVETVVSLGALTGVVLLGALLTSLVSLGVAVSPTGVITFLLLVVPTVVLAAAVIAVLASVRPLHSVAGGLYVAVGCGLVVLGATVGLVSVGVSAPGLPDPTIGPTLAWVDPLGFTPVVESAARALADGSTPTRLPSFGVSGATVTDRFVWEGVRLDGHALVGRGLLVAAALPLFVVGAVAFDRSDLLANDDGGHGATGDDGKHSATSDDGRHGATGEDSERTGAPAAASGAVSDLSWLGESDTTRSASWGRLVLGELRVALAGQSRRWRLGALALVVAGLAVSADTARAVVLPVAGIWPLFVWSAVGVRADRHGTVPVIGATRYAHRRPPAELAAAVLVGVASVSGVSVRLALAGELAAAVAPLGGVVCLAGVAAALGWMGGRRAFPLGALVVWYAGTLNGFAPLDVFGVTDEAIRLGVPGVAAALGLLAATVAFWTRRS